MNDKDVSEFFENLKPEDFARKTSAADVTKLSQPTSGPAAFVSFVDAMMQGIREGFDNRPADETWLPIAVLQNTDERRFYGPDDDETNSMLMSRLHREAADMKATWFFTAMIGHVGMWSDTDDLETNPERQVVAIMWYAECREADFQRTRQGVITIQDGEVHNMGLGGIAVLGGKAGINYEGDESGAADLFKSVLRQHV